MIITVDSEPVHLAEDLVHFAREDGQRLAWMCGTLMFDRDRRLPSEPPLLSDELEAHYWETQIDLSEDEVAALAWLATMEFKRVWPDVRDQITDMMKVVDPVVSESSDQSEEAPWWEEET